MHLDALDLKEFYGTALGSVVRRLLGRHLRKCWKDVRNARVFGLGYATPYLGQFRHEAEPLGALMPGELGAVPWPTQGPRSSVLVDATDLPLIDECADLLLLVHMLEWSEKSRALLRELWRVLSPNGRLLIVVPNRRGLWARIDTTSFGYGHPYSRGQLERLLGDCFYAPTGWWPGLFMPPVHRQLVLNTAIAWERVGHYTWPGFSGVLIVEAQKRIYAPIGKAAKAPKGKFQTVPARVSAMAEAVPVGAPR